MSLSHFKSMDPSLNLFSIFANFFEDVGLYFLVNLLHAEFCGMCSHGIIYHVPLSLVFPGSEK